MKYKYTASQSGMVHLIRDNPAVNRTMCGRKPWSLGAAANWPKWDANDASPEVNGRKVCRKCRDTVAMLRRVRHESD